MHILIGSKMNLSLPPELEKIIQFKVDSGLYSNASEVVRDAIRRMDEQDAWRDLQAFIAPRLAAAHEGKIITQSFDDIIDEVDE